MVKVIGRHQMSAVIAGAVGAVGFTGRLLTFNRETRIEGKAVLAWQASGVAGGSAREPDRAPPRAVDPDGKAFIALYFYVALGGAQKGLEKRKSRKNRTQEGRSPSSHLRSLLHDDLF